MSGHRNKKKTRTIFLVCNSSGSHSLPRYTVPKPKPRAIIASETLLANRRFRSLVDKDPFDDLAPVLWNSSSTPGGEKSNVGTEVITGPSDSGSGSDWGSVGAFGGGASAEVAVSAFRVGGGVGVGVGVGDVGFIFFLGGRGGFFEAKYLADWTSVRRGIDLENIENILYASEKLHDRHKFTTSPTSIARLIFGRVCSCLFQRPKSFP